MTRFQLRARYQNALRDPCSWRTHAPTTTKSRTVMENQLRRYRSGVMFFSRIRNRFFTECMLMTDGSARRFPGSTLRTWYPRASGVCYF